MRGARTDHSHAHTPSRTVPSPDHPHRHRHRLLLLATALSACSSTGRAAPVATAGRPALDAAGLAALADDPPATDLPPSTATTEAAGFAGRDGAASDDAQHAVDQSTPGVAAAGYFTAGGDVRFADACAVLAPVVRARYASAGQDCQTGLADLLEEPTQAAIGTVTEDGSAVEVTGDTALVPGSALSRSDLPDGAQRPRFPDVRASRPNALWYLGL